MRTLHKEDGIVSEAEARICLTCPEKICPGECERLRKEKKRLYEESLPKPLYRLDEEFIIPDEAPWPKKNPHINKR